MLNTYIKNQGITKTIIHDNNRNHVNQINWDADYDGNIANISVNTNTNGKRNHFDVSLDNQDLANILNIQSVDMPIDKRLKMDVQEPYYRAESYYKPEPYFIEIPKSKKNKYLEEFIDRRISSPLNGEELIIPLTIDRKNKSHKHTRSKSHITHKVYKKPKSTSKKSKSRSKSRRKTILL